jgi:hypothetical protein
MAMLGGCLYAPEPQEVPDIPDGAPFYFAEDVLPVENGVVRIRLDPGIDNTQEATFELANLYDRQPGDVVEVRWLIEKDNRLEEEQRYELTSVPIESGVGRYDVPPLRFRYCEDPLDGVTPGFRVRLRIRDEIPTADRPRPTATSYEIELVWDVTVNGSC